MLFTRKQKSEVIAGLDIGTTAVRLVVGKLELGEAKHADIQAIALVEVPSEGVHRGIVTSIEETVSAISSALEHAEKIIGVPVEHAWVGISGSHISSQESRGVIAVAKADGEISDEDVARAVNAARTVSTPLNYEILHVLPRSFAVDGQTGIKDPVGMSGIRLEVETQIIQGSASFIKNLTKAVYRTGIDIDDLVFSILATSEAVLSSRQKDLGVAVVNIGGSTTSMAVFEEGDIMQTAVIPIGSSNITNDLAIGLRSSIDIAERVKREFGECVHTNQNSKDLIDLAAVGADISEEVYKKDIVDYIGARTEEILEKIDQELVKIGRSHLLPVGIVFTGGGSKLVGLVELAKHNLGLPASLGYPTGVVGVSENINDLSFSTAIGLMKWGAQVRSGTMRGRGMKIASADKLSNRVKGWFKSLVP